MFHWMFECKCREVSFLISESMDRRLPLHRRLGVRFHLRMCQLCARYREQLLFLREISRRHGQAHETDSLQIHMSESARRRIKTALKDLDNTE